MLEECFFMASVISAINQTGSFPYLCNRRACLIIHFAAVSTLANSLLLMAQPHGASSFAVQSHAHLHRSAILFVASAVQGSEPGTIDLCKQGERSQHPSAHKTSAA